MNDNPTRRLETLRARGADLAARLMHLDTEIGEAAGADDDPLLAQLLAERSTLQAKIEAVARAINTTKAELSEEGREQRRAEIEGIETLAVAALTADAEDAARVECLLNDLADVLRAMHDRGASLRAALAPMYSRTRDGGRVDFGLADDLAHVSGTLGELLRSELARRGVFDTVAPRSGRDWNPRPSNVTLAEHYRDRIDRQTRRVSRVIDDALAGV